MAMNMQTVPQTCEKYLLRCSVMGVLCAVADFNEIYIISRIHSSHKNARKVTNVFIKNAEGVVAQEFNALTSIQNSQADRVRHPIEPYNLSVMTRGRGLD